MVYAVVVIFGLTAAAVAYGEDYDDDSGRSGGGSNVLGSTVMGGLLGAGLGAAIGSGSGYAGKGAAIGAGIGAVGGALMGASKDAQERQYREPPPPDYRQPRATEAPAPEGSKIKKRVIREYDADGNVISEKEVSN
ncbi:MAG: hypothetical protein JW919_07045 [Candidatus Omnitrophica bacterium]|nr:hypothetical protein [Candidatus Omnitrophota bacterium]